MNVFQTTHDGGNYGCGHKKVCVERQGHPITAAVPPDLSWLGGHTTLVCHLLPWSADPTDYVM